MKSPFVGLAPFKNKEYLQEMKKADQTKAKIMRSAAFCLAHFGERETTFQAIADHCGVSQPLVVKYLKNREGIFSSVLEEMVEKARSITVETLSQSSSAKEALTNYLFVSLENFERDQTISKIYLMLHYFAGIDLKYKAINSQIKKVAVDRIYGILEAGVESGEFRHSLDTYGLARIIHDGMVGILLSAITEVGPPPTRKTIKDFSDAIQALVKA